MIFFFSSSNLRLRTATKINCLHFSIKKISLYVLYFPFFFIALLVDRMRTVWTIGAGKTCANAKARSFVEPLFLLWANCKIVNSLIYAYVALWYNWIICFVKWFMEKWFKFWPTLAIHTLFLRSRNWKIFPFFSTNTNLFRIFFSLSFFL